MQPVSPVGRPKLVKKTWRETFGITGVKVRRKILLSPGQNFRWSEVPGCTLQSAEYHPSNLELYTSGA